MNENDNKEITREIGRRIKTLRLEKGYTLAELSQKTGISVSMISKIENSQTFPPLATYANIATGLGLFIGELISNGKQSSDMISIVRAEERTVISHGPYIGSPLAFRKGKNKMEPFLLSYPTGKSHPKLYTHEYEELIFVIEGTIEFKYGEKTIVLQKGDCAYYDGRIPHAGIALYRQRATALVVQSR